LGLSQRQIAASCAVGQATVSDYLKTAEAAGLRWPDIAEWSEDQVMQAVAPSREKPGQRNQSPEPDYAAIRHELQTHKHVTLQLLWEEYRETIRKATATAASVIYTKDGFGDKKSFCDTSIGRARSYLSTTPGIPFPSTLVRTATRRRRRSSSRYWEPATTVTPRRLARRPHAHLRVSGGRARDHRPRQSEVGHHQSLPLRAECQSDVRGDGRALRCGGNTGTAGEAARQSQGGSGCAVGRALDPGRPAKEKILPFGRSQPSHSGTTG